MEHSMEIHQGASARALVEEVAGLRPATSSALENPRDRASGITSPIGSLEGEVSGVATWMATELRIGPEALAVAVPPVFVPPELVTPGTFPLKLISEVGKVHSFKFETCSEDVSWLIGSAFPVFGGFFCVAGKVIDGETSPE